MLVSHIALYGSIAIQDMANLFKFIPFTTSSIPIGFINPLQVPPEELYSKTPNTLACSASFLLTAITFKWVLIQIQSIGRKNIDWKKQAFVFCNFSQSSQSWVHIFVKRKNPHIWPMDFLVEKTVAQKSSQLPTFGRWISITKEVRYCWKWYARQEGESMMITNLNYYLKYEEGNRITEDIESYQKCSKCF